MLLLPILLCLQLTQQEDRTAAALERCLSEPADRKRAVPPQTAPDDEAEEGPPPGLAEDGSPPPDPDGAGRDACYDAALRAYDGRVLRTYRTLLGRVAPEAAGTFIQANQQWLSYRGEASRNEDAVARARDHALWLEGLLRGR
jgi:hypothetical protein